MLPKSKVSHDGTALILMALSDFRCAHTNPHPITFPDEWKVQDHPSQTPLIWFGSFEANDLLVTKMGSCSPNPNRSLALQNWGLPALVREPACAPCCCAPWEKWTFHVLPTVAWCNGYVLGKEYSSSDIIITMDITHGKLTSLARHSLYPLYHWSQQWV